MYGKIKIYGGCDVNYIWSKKGQLSNDDIDEIVNAGITSPKWDYDTITLSVFNNTLYANNYIVDENITGYSIQRKNTKENVIYPVAKIDNTDIYIYDYNIQNTNSYIYYITPIIFKDGVERYGEYLETSPINIDTNYITICDLLPSDEENKYIVDKKNIWAFELNIKSRDIQPTYNKRINTGFGKFPKTSHDNLNYLKMGFDTLLGNLECSSEKYINDNIEKLEKWYEFCNNGNIKLLKDIRGHVIPCDIETTSLTSSDETITPFTTVSFNVCQVADRKDISAYSMGVWLWRT